MASGESETVGKYKCRLNAEGGTSPLKDEPSPSFDLLCTKLVTKGLTCLDDYIVEYLDNQPDFMLRENKDGKLYQKENHAYVKTTAVLSEESLNNEDIRAKLGALRREDEIYGKKDYSYPISCPSQ